MEFAAAAGLVLDPWQREVLAGSLGVIKGGRWASRNVGLLVPRQNGKGAVLEARELFGMFVLNEPLIIHSAHRFDTSQEHFLRMRNLIDGNADLSKHVKSVYTANGKESIELRNGCRLKFKARTLAGGGRGFSCDCLVLDEAMLLPEQALSAMSPTMLARKNPQTWFTSSAGTPDSAALWRIVKQGRSKVKRLAYYEWGVDLDADVADPQVWAAANPGLGFRLPLDELQNEFDTLAPEDFAREHLGMWDDQAAGGAFGPQVWDALLDPDSKIEGPSTFAVEVAEDRSWSCIAAAGDGPAGLHGESVDYRRDVGWVADRVVELSERHVSAAVVVQPSSPAGSLIAELRDRQVRVVEAKAQEYAQACGLVFDAVTGGELHHLGQPELDVSVRGARRKKSADAWVWNRRTPSLDISPLVAVTLAVWGHKVHGAVDVAESVW